MTTEKIIHNEQQTIPLDQALKNARLAANFTVEEIAQRLNLKQTVIENLENNLERMIADEVYPLIYLRGYLINYGKKVNLPDVESYPEFQSLSHPAESVTSLQNTYIFNDPRKNTRKILLLSLLSFAIVIIGIVYYNTVSEDASQAEVANVETTNVETTNVETINISAPVTATPAIAEPLISAQSPSEKTTRDKTTLANESVVQKAVTEAEVKPTIEPEEVDKAAPPVEETPVVPEASPVVIAAKPTVAKPTAPKPATKITESVSQVATSKPSTVVPQAVKSNDVAEQSTLRLMFEAESWAVVTDAKGKRLAFGLYQSGKELDLAGTAPFSLKIGNPTAVVMYFQDQLVENNFVQGKMANFSLPQK